MQPTAVPLTELLERLVFILNALLRVLGLAIAEDVLAALLKPGEPVQPEGAERADAAGASFASHPGTAPRPAGPRDGKPRCTSDAVPERGGPEEPADCCGEPALAAIMTDGIPAALPPGHQVAGVAWETVVPWGFGGTGWGRAKRSQWAAARICVYNVTI